MPFLIFINLLIHSFIHHGRKKAKKSALYYIQHCFVAVKVTFGVKYYVNEVIFCDQHYYAGRWLLQFLATNSILFGAYWLWLILGTGVGLNVPNLFWKDSIDFGEMCFHKCASNVLLICSITRRMLCLTDVLLLMAASVLLMLLILKVLAHVPISHSQGKAMREIAGGGLLVEPKCS